jgi:hypothetical protein
MALAGGPYELPAGIDLQIKLSGRITCTGASHASGTLRLWYNDAQAGSNFVGTIDGSVEDYFLRSSGGLGATQGAGPKATTDVQLNSKVKCNAADPTKDRPFTPIGDWTIEL